MFAIKFVQKMHIAQSEVKLVLKNGMSENSNIQEEIHYGHYGQEV